VLWKPSIKTQTENQSEKTEPPFPNIVETRKIVLQAKDQRKLKKDFTEACQDEQRVLKKVFQYISSKISE
jgi:hypothetical protein